ncbi:ATP-binding protein [Paractinoplanes atraurantiacus]|uniref:AAA ATPase domain-containing protein n=1 Tax=Paractinoplanes atraurantiacus TaxID=1036182 RepID=A0A285K3Y2_9ACTN|nr:ATP-binding protein [Actinoplanes atraurantiacus]SNY66041.1 AAA ATPase domain-containing protein [Actinoplanes atraurantiacus]
MTPHLRGRERELERLTAVLQEVAGGEGQALVLRGPAGIGKTTLVAHAAAEARGQGWRVLRAAGVQAEVNLPYGGLERLLRPVVTASRRQSIDEMLLDGETDEADLRPYRVALAVLERLDDGEARPTLMVVDDAQWLDEATWQVLSYVGRRLGDDAFLLLMSMRDGEETTRRLTGSGLPEMTIGPVSDEAAREIVGGEAPGLPTVLVLRVVEEAGGNPLGLHELATAASSAGERALVPSGLPLPQRLDDTFSAAIADLPAPSRHVLRVAALHDTDDAEEILAAAGLTAAAVRPAIDARLAELGDGALRLRHPLIRSAVLRSIPAAERRAVHAALAAAVRDDDRRTWHRAAAVTGQDEALGEAMAGLAFRLRTRGASHTALSAWERAAELTADPGRRAYRLVKAIDCGYDSGDLAAINRLGPLIDESRLTPHEMLSIVARRNAVDGYGEMGDAQLMTFIRTAEQWLDAGDVDGAFDLIIMIVFRLYFINVAPGTRQAALAFVERSGRGLDDQHVLAFLGLISPLDNGRAVLDALPHQLTQPIDTQFQMLLGATSLAVGSLSLAKQFLGTAAARCRTQQRVGLLAQTLVTQAWTSAFGHDAYAADGAAAEAVRLGDETGWPHWTATARMAQGMVAALRGEDAIATQMADGAEKALLGAGLHGMLCLVQLIRGTTALASGNATAAFDHLSRTFDAADMAYTRPSGSGRWARWPSRRSSPVVRMSWHPCWTSWTPRRSCAARPRSGPGWSTRGRRCGSNTPSTTTRRRRPRRLSPPTRSTRRAPTTRTASGCAATASTARPGRTFARPSPSSRRSAPRRGPPARAGSCARPARRCGRPATPATVSARRSSRSPRWPRKA